MYIENIFKSRWVKKPKLTYISKCDNSLIFCDYVSNLNIVEMQNMKVIDFFNKLSNAIESPQPRSVWKNWSKNFPLIFFIMILTITYLYLTNSKFEFILALLINFLKQFESLKLELKWESYDVKKSHFILFKGRII